MFPRNDAQRKLAVAMRVSLLVKLAVLAVFLLLIGGYLGGQL